MKDVDDNDEVISSVINSEVSTSVEGRRPSSTAMPLKSRKTTCIQAGIFSDETKERSLSVTTQMFGKLQDGEIKRFLTGLGNLAKSCELQNIENSPIPKRPCFNDKGGTIKCHSASNAITKQESYSSMEYGNVDTVLISKQAKNMMDKSCAV